MKPLIGTTITGGITLDKLKRNLESMNVREDTAWAIRKLAPITESGIKQGITRMNAVDTGFMRSSTRIQKLTDTEAIVGPTADYSIYVHEGTSRMSARKFIPFGLAIKKNSIDKIVADTGIRLVTQIVR